MIFLIVDFSRNQYSFIFHLVAFTFFFGLPEVSCKPLSDPATHPAWTPLSPNFTNPHSGVYSLHQNSSRKKKLEKKKKIGELEKCLEKIWLLKRSICPSQDLERGSSIPCLGENESLLLAPGIFTATSCHSFCGNQFRASVLWKPI